MGGLGPHIPIWVTYGSHLVLVSAHEPHKSLLEQLVANAPELLYSGAVSHHSRVVEIIPLDHVKKQLMRWALPQSWSFPEASKLLATSGKMVISS